MNDVTRREFIASATVGAACAIALPNALAANRENYNRFSFLLLGDTHFDRIKHHDIAWMHEHFAKDISQVENYCRHTEEKLPRLLKAAKSRLGKADPSTAFALHVGDLVEGICGNNELATRHCEEGWEFFKQANLGVPLLMTKGNHDVTGPGSVEAYNEVLLQKTAKELGRDKLERTSYSFKQGDNLFAVFDAYDRDAIDWLEELVSKTDFRRLFVLMHLPVVPYNARSNWRVYYHERQAERRQRLVDLLGQHRAIVLCGHLHKYSLLVRRCKTGKFAQLAISSVMKNAAGKPHYSKASDYGPHLASLEAMFSPDTLDVRETVLSNEKPFIEHFEYAHNSGFAMLSVRADDVHVEVYDGTEPTTPWKTVSLSKLLS